MAIVAAAASEHAGDVDSRSRDSQRRHRSRHARALVLDPRRHHATATIQLRADRTQRFISSRRKSRIASSATSTPTRRCRPKNPRDKTRRTAQSSTITCKEMRRRPSRSRSSTARINSFVVIRATTNRTPMNPNDYAVPAYWFRPPQVLRDKSGNAAVCLGFEVRAAACVRSRLSDLGDLSRHAALSAWSISVAGHLHREADSERQVALLQPLTVKMDPRVKTPLPDLTTAVQSLAGSVSRHAADVR